MSDVKNPIVTITMADGRVMTGELYPDKEIRVVLRYQDQLANMVEFLRSQDKHLLKTEVS